MMTHLRQAHCRCGAVAVWSVVARALLVRQTSALLCDPCAMHLVGTLRMLEDTCPGIYTAHFRSLVTGDLEDVPAGMGVERKCVGA
jgi:hypothetical protein